MFAVKKLHSKGALRHQVRRDHLPGQEQDRLVRQDHRQQREDATSGISIEARFTGFGSFGWDVDIIDLRSQLDGATHPGVFNTTSRSLVPFSLDAVRLGYM